MTLAAYNGHEALTFTDYLDLGTGKTLHAKPGVTYDVAPASGRVVPDFPDPWFTPVFATGGVVTGSAGLAGEGAAAEGDAAPGSGDEEAGGEPAHDEDPETDTSQQF
jgi:hypothetical protein